MTPNIGQGANSGIEDAAALSSLIYELVNVQGNTKPPDEVITQLLSHFQASRYSRVEKIYQRSRFGVRLHTRDDLLKRLVGRYVIPLRKNRLGVMASQMIAGGAFVHYLPLPQRQAGSEDGVDKISTKCGLLRSLGLIPIVLVIVFVYAAFL